MVDSSYSVERANSSYSLLALYLFFLSESHMGLKATGKDETYVLCETYRLFAGSEKVSGITAKSTRKTFRSRTPHVIRKSTAMKEIWTDKQLRLISVSLELVSCFI